MAKRLGKKNVITDPMFKMTDATLIVKLNRGGNLMSQIIWSQSAKTVSSEAQNYVIIPIELLLLVVNRDVGK